MTTTCIAPGGPSLSGYKHHRCPCAACLAANRAYNGRARRLNAYGRWQALVDAQPVREHVQSLRSHYGIERIAELAGVAYATVNTLIHPIGGTVRTHLRKQTADALLAVQPALSAVRDGRPVDATGTRRRIQALAAIGHPLIRQSLMVGRDRNFAGSILTRQQVTAHTARQVRDLYERLENRPRLDAIGKRTRRFAASHGWAPPAAWDDIDDPAEQPQGVRHPNQAAPCRTNQRKAA